MTRYIYRIILLILMTSVSAVAAPVGAIAAPVGNTGYPLFQDDGLQDGLLPFHLSLSFETDYQKNTLPEQIHRFQWADPGQVNSEVRHYEQIRSSTNTFFTNGIRVGGMIGETSQVYLMAGSLIADMDITYYDKTVSYGFFTGSKFESDSEFYYGAGFSILMYQGAYKEKTPVSVGMDLKYRKLEMSDGDQNEACELSLDEIQISFVVDAEIGRYYPYVGFRISSMTGKEYYMNKNIPVALSPARYYDNGYIEYRRDITWFRNIGYVGGVSFYLNDIVLMNAELRYGDEEAFGLSASVKF